MLSLLQDFSTTIFNTTTSLVSKCILASMGWTPINQETFDNIEEHKRLVLVFSHTSYADFYIVLLYFLAYPYQLRNVRMLVKPQPFAYAGWLLRKFGAIPATKVEEKQGGATKRIVDDLNSSNKCVFLVSPKGTIVNAPWRSGYYHIAQGIKADLMVAGLDYEKKQVVVIDKSISSSIEHEAVEKHLKEQMGQIVPLFPDEEVVPIRQHNNKLRSILDLMQMFKVFISGTLSIILYWQFKKYFSLYL